MMNRIIAGLFVIAVAWSAGAVDKSELENRLNRVISKFAAMQAKSDKAVPADTLRKARGIVLLDRTKAGFIFAYQGGSGLAMVKDPKSDKWGPVAFMKANEASLGFQIGGQQSFLVLLLMTDEAAKKLTESKFDFGGEARGTAGDVSGGAEGTVSSTELPMLVYDDREGLFGGAALKGGAVTPDEEANRVYYGGPVTLSDILFQDKVKPTTPALELAKKIEEFRKKK